MATAVSLALTGCGDDEASKDRAAKFIATKSYIDSHCPNLVVDDVMFGQLISETGISAETVKGQEFQGRTAGEVLLLRKVHTPEMCDRMYEMLGPDGTARKGVLRRR